MKQQIQDNVEDVTNGYQVIIKTKDDILDNMSFDTKEDKLLCSDIIDNLDKSIADGLRQQKIVQIPLIGCLRINPVRKEFNENRKALKAIRKSVNKDQYRQYIKDYIGELRNKQRAKDSYKLIITRIKKCNKKKYDYFARNLGYAYAELFIISVYWLKEVPFDAEWEEWYQSLKE